MLERTGARSCAAAGGARLDNGRQDAGNRIGYPAQRYQQQTAAGNQRDCAPMAVGETVAQLEITLGMESGFDHARSILGRAYLRLGRPDRAIEEFRRRRSTTIGSAADLPTAFACSGRGAEATSELNQLIAAEETQYVAAYDIATVWTNPHNRSPFAVIRNASQKRTASFRRRTNAVCSDIQRCYNAARENRN